MIDFIVIVSLYC